MREYSSGSVAARTTAAIGPILAMTATITSGKTIRMPKTAIAMPQVMKRRRQTGSICASTVALTTALSNDSDTSSTPSTATMKTVVSVPPTVPVYSQPSAAPASRPRTVTRNEPRKYRIVVIRCDLSSHSEGPRFWHAQLRRRCRVCTYRPRGRA